MVLPWWLMANEYLMAGILLADQGLEAPFISANNARADFRAAVISFPV